MTQQAAATEMYAGITQLIDNEWNDGLSRSSPMLDMVVKGDSKKKESGGIYIQFPIKLITNSSQGFIGGQGGVVSVSPSMQFQYGALNWKFFYYGTNFTLYDMTVSGGDTEKFDMIAGKIKGALADGKRAMASATHVGSSSNALAFEGLADVGAASGTSYAGLTDTDYTETTNEYLPYISTATQATYATVSDMINTIRARIQQSDFDPARIFGLMNSGVFSKFQQSVQASQMFIDTKDMYNVGMQGFRVNGVEFYLDSYTAGSNSAASSDNYIWIVPMDVFRFHFKFGFGLPSPFDCRDLRIPDQPILTTQNYIAGNWVCENRRLVAVCKTIII